MKFPAVLFFLPYIFLYLWFWFYELSPKQLIGLFQAMHGVGALALLVVAWSKGRKLEKEDVFFWTALTAVFLLPGAYLEFPSDAWEHWDRTVTWNWVTQFSWHGTRQRFIYFWNWTWLSPLSPECRRYGFDVLSAFWQLVLWSSAFSFLRQLGFSKPHARLQIVAGIFFLGTSVFGFRYYALSGTPIAYALYMAALSLLLAGWKNPQERKQWLWLAPLSVGIYFNHPQELAFLILNTTAISLWFVLRPRLRSHPHLALALALALALWSIVSIFWLPTEAWTLLTNPNDRIATTYALPGLIGFIFAWTLLRSHPLFALLSILPLTLLICPLTLGALLRFVSVPSDVYRLLYAFPIPFAFALAVLRGVNHFKLKAPVHWAAGIIALSSLIPFYPWLGRGFAQLYSPPKTLQLNWIPQTEETFNALGGPRRWCRMETDPATLMALRPWLYEFRFQEERNARLNATSALYEVRDRQALDDLIAKSGVCAFLMVDPALFPSVPWSRLGKLSGHWSPHHLSHAISPPPELQPLLETLSEKGWVKSQVPPFYNLWLLPH